MEDSFKKPDMQMKIKAFQKEEKELKTSHNQIKGKMKKSVPELKKDLTFQTAGATKCQT